MAYISMFFSKRHNFLARLLLTATLFAGGLPVFAESYSEEEIRKEAQGILSKESEAIHQEEVDQILLSGLAYSDEERLADFPDIDSLLQSPSVPKKTRELARVEENKISETHPADCFSEISPQAMSLIFPSLLLGAEKSLFTVPEPETRPTKFFVGSFGLSSFGPNGGQNLELGKAPKCQGSFVSGLDSTLGLSFSRSGSEQNRMRAAFLQTTDRKDSSLPKGRVERPVHLAPKKIGGKGMQYSQSILLRNAFGPSDSVKKGVQDFAGDGPGNFRNPVKEGGGNLKTRELSPSRVQGLSETFSPVARKEGKSPAYAILTEVRRAGVGIGAPGIYFLVLSRT